VVTTTGLKVVLLVVGGHAPGFMYCVIVWFVPDTYTRGASEAVIDSETQFVLEGLKKILLAVTDAGVQLLDTVLTTQFVGQELTE
jgi:hypothetical protein